MSKTAIGKIIDNGGSHGANDKKTAAKEAKQKTDEIVKELVSDAEQPGAKRGPGRPPKSTSRSPGRKSPANTLNEINSAHSTTSSGAPMNPADKIRNQLLIRKLQLYVRKFPEYARFFEGYNPTLSSPDDNKKILDAFLDLIHTEVEFATAPAAVSGTISSVEDAAIAWAISNPGHPGAKIVEELQGVSSAVLDDKAVSLDIRLLECEITGFLPKNPKLRLLLNIARSTFQYWSKNRLNTVAPPNPDPGNPPPQEQFKQL